MVPEDSFERARLGVATGVSNESFYIVSDRISSGGVAAVRATALLAGQQVVGYRIEFDGDAWRALDLEANRESVPAALQASTASTPWRKLETLDFNDGPQAWGSRDSLGRSRRAERGGASAVDAGGAGEQGGISTANHEHGSWILERHLS